MYLCYIDESGTSSIPGNTSHFVLAGLAIPISHWKDCDSDINRIKANYKLQDIELHVGWIKRPYVEQNKILNFDTLDYTQRKSRVEQLRKAELFRLQKKNDPNYKRTKKTIKKLNLMYI